MGLIEQNDWFKRGRRSADAEIERLRRANEDALRDGLEARADAEVAQRQLAGAVDAETLERYRWALDEAVRFMTDKRGNPDAIKALLVLAEWGQ